MALPVPVRVYACTLGEDGVPDYRLVCRYPDSGNALHISAHRGQLIFVQCVRHFQMIVEHTCKAGNRGISGALPEAVHGDMDSPDSGPHGSHRIGHRKVIVVVPVEIEMYVRVSGGHPVAEIIGLFRGQYPEGVREHEPPDSRILKRISHREDIVRRIDHAVGPVLEIEIDCHAFGES